MTTRLWKFLQSRTANLLDEKRLLDEADVFRLYLGALYHQHYTFVDKDVPESILQLKQIPGVTAQSTFINKSVTDQVTLMLSGLHNSYNIRHRGKRTIVDILHKVHGSQPEVKEETNKTVDFSPAFTLHSRPSTITGAGNGVSLEGHAVPGSVVGFFPGVVYTPLDLRYVPNYPNVSLNNDYLAIRPDNMVIDAKDYKCELQRKGGAGSTAKRSGDSERNELSPSHNGHEQGKPQQEIIDHPYALGHMVNHPQQPQSHPNVLTFAYDVPSTIPEHLRPFIPNKYYKEHPLLYGWGGCIMRTQVLIATTHIKDEELFINYRFNPTTSLPEWYVPYSLEEDKRRWSSR